MSDGQVNRSLARLDILPGHYVLDLGCGDGVHSQEVKLMSPGLSVALDLNLLLLKNLSHSTSLGEMETFPRVCADALKLPFPNEAFDRVICSLVLYFLPFEMALTELSRLVKMDGRVYLRVPMLTGDRITYVFQHLIRNPRISMYTALLTINGLYYSLTGSQLANPLLRNDRMAIFVPRKRFEEAVTRAGFCLEGFEIDKPKPHTAAIDAWLRKIR